jgi:tetratricopeptide (TPR) repeat protein
MSKRSSDSRHLERRVVDAYRQMGAWRVERDLELAGNRVAIYVELATPGRLLHRVVVEAKGGSSPVGIDIVNGFGQRVKLLHSERLVDEGIIISTAGFSGPALRAARAYGIRLLQLADLEAGVAEAKSMYRTRPAVPADHPSPDVDGEDSAELLASIIELYHRTLAARLYDEAIGLYRDRLADQLFFRLGAYQTEIDLLCALFPDNGVQHVAGSGEILQRGLSLTDVQSAPGQSSAQVLRRGSGQVALPRLGDRGAQAWTLNALASSCSCSGQLRAAVPLLEMHNALQDELDNGESLAIGLENLARVELELGKLVSAERNLRWVIAWASARGEIGLEASSRRELSRLLAYRGSFEEAQCQLDAASEIVEGTGLTRSKGTNWLYRAQCALLGGEPETVLEAVSRALHQAGGAAGTTQFVYPAGDLVWACWLTGAAHLELAQQDEAEIHLTEALSRCRHIRLVELEPDILLSWARWHQASGDRNQGKRCAEEALAIADGCDYRLKQAEIHLFLARWELGEGNALRARERTEIAVERAWCDGPPQSYKAVLDEADWLVSLT